MLENITDWLNSLGYTARDIIDTPQIILLALLMRYPSQLMRTPSHTGELAAKPGVDGG